MSKQSLAGITQGGGIGQELAIPLALVELQGQTISTLAGTTANTKINVAALRTEDTILSAIVHSAGAVPVDDTANVTIVDTHASGTLTISGAVADDTAQVNGVTYTFKAAPTLPNHVKLTAGNNTANALALATAINAYENRYAGSGQNKAAVVASANAAVVTVTSVVDGAGNGSTITGSGTLTITGSGGASVTVAPATVIATNTLVVNGVTFTCVASGATDTQFNLKGTNALQGVEIARAVAQYQNKYGTLGATASANAGTGLVTLTPVAPLAGNVIPLVGGTHVTASGSGTLAGGSDTGGIKTTTDTSTKVVVLTWLNKH